MQGSLFASGDVGLADLSGVDRLVLDPQCWVDVLPSWVGGGDALFADLARSLAWSEATRPMYGRVVAVPRLTAPVRTDDPATPDVVAEMVDALSRHYGDELTAVFSNYYRDGADSVAWHGDRTGRSRPNPLVAVVSLGGRRRFALRPMAGGRSHRLSLASGDLLVMGGACQHRWQHAVPKMARAEPRISLTFRSAADDITPARVDG